MWVRRSILYRSIGSRSGAPDFICLPFGWRIHFAMSFLLLLPFRPLLASMKIVCQNAWCHIFDGDTFYFNLFIFQCDVFPCLSSSWQGLVIHFAPELLTPSWCCALFCLSFLVHMFGGSCTGEMCHLFLIWLKL